MFHEEDTVGFKSDNGTWTGMIGRVSSGEADISVLPLVVTKERAEEFAYTDTFKSIR